MGDIKVSGSEQTKRKRTDSYDGAKRTSLEETSHNKIGEGAASSSSYESFRLVEPPGVSVPISEAIVNRVLQFFPCIRNLLEPANDNTIVHTQNLRADLTHDPLEGVVEIDQLDVSLVRATREIVQRQIEYFDKQVVEPYLKATGIKELREDNGWLRKLIVSESKLSTLCQRPFTKVELSIQQVTHENTHQELKKLAGKYPDRISVEDLKSELEKVVQSNEKTLTSKKESLKVHITDSKIKHGIDEMQQLDRVLGTFERNLQNKESSREDIFKELQNIARDNRLGSIAVDAIEMAIGEHNQEKEHQEVWIQEICSSQKSVIQYKKRVEQIISTCKGNGTFVDKQFFKQYFEDRLTDWEVIRGGLEKQESDREARQAGYVRLSDEVLTNNAKKVAKDRIIKNLQVRLDEIKFWIDQADTYQQNVRKSQTNNEAFPQKIAGELTYASDELAKLISQMEAK